MTDERTDVPGLGLFAGPADDPDRYELISLEGSGGEGLVYRGCLRSGAVIHDVALKELTTPHAGGWRAQVELLRSLQHPAIVPIREGFDGHAIHERGTSGAEPGHRYVVMNWINGYSLSELVTAEEIDARQAFDMLVPIAEALELCHSGSRTGGVPIVHRDVKPSNILINDGGAVLVDFGVSVTAGTQIGAGSPSFRAPEWNRSPAAPELDAYGLGATAAFVLLGGQYPHDRPGDLHRQLLTSKAVHIDPAAVQRVLQLCSADPSARPTDLAAQLRNIGEATEWATPGHRPTIVAPRGSPTSQVDRAGSTAIPRASWKRVAVALTVPVVIVAAAVAALLISKSSDDPNDTNTDADVEADVEADAEPVLSNVTCDPSAYVIEATALGLDWIDPDGDCLTTAYELGILGSDSSSADSDGDGIIDSLDPTTCSGCRGIPSVEIQTADIGG